MKVNDTVAFSTIVADPAWQPRDALPGPKRGAAKHYTTMSTPDIRALAYRLPPLAPDAVLFLWRLASMPFDGLDVCRAWGFEPVSEIVWVKTPKALPEEVVTWAAQKAWGSIGRIPQALDTFTTAHVHELMTRAAGQSFHAARAVRIMLGHYVRMSHEICIIAARPGAASRILSHSIPSVLFAPLGAHSAKPAAFYELVEKLAPAPRLELFARAARPGWTCLGGDLGTMLDLPLSPGAPTT